MRRPVAASLVTDLLLVLVFVLIGRRSHQEANEVAGLLGTFWPFAVGALVGWASVLVRSGTSRTHALRPRAVWPTGLVVWVCTVLLGLALRVVSGQGVQFSFVIVTTLVLAAFLLGWRGLLALIRRRRP